MGLFGKLFEHRDNQDSEPGRPNVRHVHTMTHVRVAKDCLEIAIDVLRTYPNNRTRSSYESMTLPYDSEGFERLREWFRQYEQAEKC